MSTYYQQSSGKNIAKGPLENLEGLDFGDVVQIIDFQTSEDANCYPQSKEHLKLFHHGPKMIKVTAIDFEMK